MVCACVDLEWFVCCSQHSATAAAGLTADQKTLLRILTAQQQQPRCDLVAKDYVMHHTPVSRCLIDDYGVLCYHIVR